LESHTRGPMVFSKQSNKPITTITNIQNGTISSKEIDEMRSLVKTALPTTVRLKYSVTHQPHSHHLQRSRIQFDTYRNSKDNAFAWTKHLNISTVKFIQDICSVPMMKLGFDLITEESQLTDPKLEVLSVTDELKSLQKHKIIKV
jgi:hypothetical protein